MSEKYTVAKDYIIVHVSCGFSLLLPKSLTEPLRQMLLDALHDSDYKTVSSEILIQKRDANIIVFVKFQSNRWFQIACISYWNAIRLADALADYLVWDTDKNVCATEDKGSFVLCEERGLVV